MNYLGFVCGDSIGHSGLCTEDDGPETLPAAPPEPGARGQILTTDGPFAETKG